MSDKTVLQLADEWIVGFLDRQQGQTFTIGEVCRIAFQAGYVSREQKEWNSKDAVGDALSVDAIQCAQRLLGPKPSHYAIFAPENSDDADGPDLQEQLEALQQYMTVAQQKIMALQSNVEFLLYHNKEKIGESETIRRMQQTMKGFGRQHE